MDSWDLTHFYLLVGGDMKTRTVKASAMAACLVLMAVLFESPVSTHHSFAMYDQTKTVTLTGVMKQFVPQANHAELHFILLAPDHKALAKGADGKYVEWGVEMAGTAAIAQQGITGSTFPAGTVFSVHLNPLRDGSNFGSRVGALARCPTDSATNKPKLPEAGKHCDSVPGHTLIGGTSSRQDGQERINSRLPNTNSQNAASLPRRNWKLGIGNWELTN